MSIIPPAPIDGEYLWDIISQSWIPLIKKPSGDPDVVESLKNNIEKE